MPSATSPRPSTTPTRGRLLPASSPGSSDSARSSASRRGWRRDACSPEFRRGLPCRHELVPDRPDAPISPHRRAARPRTRDAPGARRLRDAALHRAVPVRKCRVAGARPPFRRYRRPRGRRARAARRQNGHPLRHSRREGRRRVRCIRRRRGGPARAARAARPPSAARAAPRRWPGRVPVARPSCRARRVRPSARGLQRLRRVRDDQGGGGTRVDPRAAGRARIVDGNQARGGGRRVLVLDKGARGVVVGARSALYRRALEVIPGGVNSPVRAMRAVGLDEPFFVRAGDGAYLEDVDGNRFLDWVMSWGPLLFGHAESDTVAAVRAAAERGTSFGAPTEAEVELASAIVDVVPSIAKVRLVSSGTEAAMSALRLARAFTARDRVIKFAGCYHGHADALLASGGSGLATLGVPASPGVPGATTSHTVGCPYNDVDSVADAVAHYGEGPAATFGGPVAGNRGVVPP